MSCTVPKLFGMKDWFEKRFGDLCEAHDYWYVHRTMSKWEADKRLARGMWKRGYKTLSVITFIACQTPYAFWLWYRD